MKCIWVPVKYILTCFSSCGGLSWWCAGLWRLPPFEGLDDAHHPAAFGAWLAKGERGDLGARPVVLLYLLCAEQRAGLRYICFAG